MLSERVVKELGESSSVQHATHCGKTHTDFNIQQVLHLKSL